MQGLTVGCLKFDKRSHPSSSTFHRRLSYFYSFFSQAENFRSKTKMNSNLLFSISILLYSQAVSAYTCYWPSGNVAQSNYVACNSTAAVSACCAANDACTTFGWCLGSSGFVYRGGCTDAHWSTDACQKDYCYTSILSTIPSIVKLKSCPQC